MAIKNSEIFTYFPERFRGLLSELRERDRLEEIRMGAMRPLVIRTREGLTPIDVPGGRVVQKDEVRQTVERMAKGSLYAVQNQLSGGYLTLPGGHRLGVVGTAVFEGGRLTHLKNISAINLRIAREVVGCAAGILPVIAPGGAPQNTLIIAPPGCGKTTLLRDIARSLGGEEYRLSVGLADERGEIAASYLGVPGNDVGIYTDVLDSCPKALAMEMLIRSMSPQVVITDEIGSEEDARSIYALLNAGVKVICSAHGFGERDCMRRAGLRELLRDNIFECVIVLSRRQGPGTVERIR